MQSATVDSVGVLVVIYPYRCKSCPVLAHKKRDDFSQPRGRCLGDRLRSVDHHHNHRCDRYHRTFIDRSYQRPGPLEPHNVADWYRREGHPCEKDNIAESHRKLSAQVGFTPVAGGFSPSLNTMSRCSGRGNTERRYGNASMVTTPKSMIDRVPWKASAASKPHIGFDVARSATQLNDETKTLASSTKDSTIACDPLQSPIFWPISVEAAPIPDLRSLLDGDSIPIPLPRPGHRAGETGGEDMVELLTLSALRSTAPLQCSGPFGADHPPVAGSSHWGRLIYIRRSVGSYTTSSVQSLILLSLTLLVALQPRVIPPHGNNEQLMLLTMMF